MVAFLGPSGGGKSTTAAGLYRRGHTHVADDIVAVRTSATPPEVEAGLPEFRLWPESATAVGYDAEHLERLSVHFEKRLQTNIGRLAAAPLPLRHIFALETGTHVAIEEFTGRDALAQLLIHSYAAASLLSGGGDEHMTRCQTVLDTVPVTRLVRTPRLEDLDLLLDAIEQRLGVRVAT